ncbi:glycosyltransferase family 4 protein [Noviherbaspirillum pedocola]|uniref:Glycosyltransferase family 4 protein n=1 Tax=Noviherbaspirillum pedocola TaxID=2801341 RepID=A0A934W0N0_9BURK|nr:glycosyltransferase family 4 protein [Noviherbaspirillum pedocola]MBK4734291.1 glycosyltransferase family 4 protein [Noviherbaspirillum pedocola]
MKLLTFSTLFPNAQRPNHGIFVETRLRYLLASRQVQSRVVAPVPWFPFKHERFGVYGTLASVPQSEVRHGIDVTHPRYPVIPKVGMSAAPLLLAKAMKPVIGRVIDEGYDFDAIDAHYFYPDGVAAVMLGRYFNKPVVITARGTDINLVPQYALPRRMIRWAAEHAAGMITVCNALKDEMVGLGIAPDRITPLRNGVDLQLFQPGDRQALRAERGMEGFTLMSVGHLEPRKGHELVIAAMRQLPDARLFIAGSGPDRKKLEDLAQELKVADRVRFLGPLPQSELRNWYGGADALVLASSREGWANVLLESMACGTPVVASNVWGTPEVVAAPEAGVLMAERTPRGVADAVRQLQAAYPSHEATRRYAERFSWDDTTQGQLTLFRNILGQGRA